MDAIVDVVATPAALGQESANTASEGFVAFPRE